MEQVIAITDKAKEYLQSVNQVRTMFLSVLKEVVVLVCSMCGILLVTGLMSSGQTP